jgi:hypothetical protein
MSETGLPRLTSLTTLDPAVAVGMMLIGAITVARRALLFLTQLLEGDCGCGVGESAVYGRIGG